MRVNGRPVLFTLSNITFIVQNKTVTKQKKEK